MAFSGDPEKLALSRASAETMGTASHDGGVQAVPLAAENHAVLALDGEPGVESMHSQGEDLEKQEVITP